VIVNDSFTSTMETYVAIQFSINDYVGEGKLALDG